MHRPSPALETGPLPGLSETNYKVLAGVTALGVAAPALLFVSNVVLPEMTKAKPPAKKPAAGMPSKGFALPVISTNSGAEDVPVFSM